MNDFLRKLIAFTIFINVLSYGFFDNALFLPYFYISTVLLYFVFFIYQILYNKNLIFKWSPPLLLYVLFSMLCFLSTLWALDGETSFSRSLTILQIAINVFIVQNLLDQTKNTLTFFWATISISIINFFIYLGLFGFSENILWYNWRYQGLTENPNILSIFMILSIISSILLSRNVALSNLQRFIININIPISLYLIILTSSKKGVIFGSILTLVYFVNFIKVNNFNTFMSRTIQLTLGIIIGFIAIYNIIDVSEFNLSIQKTFMRFDAFMSADDSSTAHRIYLLIRGITVALENPIFGVGVDNYKFLAGVYSHNNFIEVLSGVGLFGFITYYSIHLSIVNKLFLMKENRTALVMIIFCLIMMDAAYVSYYVKFYILTLIVLYQYIDEETNAAKQ